ncbi:MAG: VCBS repeat-containing protein [Saprospiraceae bacterium]|nr:VCBS repeat-containing protein [Lewinella sp.]
MRITTTFALCALTFSIQAQTLQPIQYNNPGLTVDLGVGLWAWPLPMDYDRDGDLDLVVACPDKPYNGIYFFENPDGDAEMPVFKAGRKIGPSARNLQLSEWKGLPMVLGPGIDYQDFQSNGISQPLPIPLEVDFKELYGRTRANQWKYLDYDEDGDRDIIIGLGVWEDYGWDNAYNEAGVWKNGPLHGYVFLSFNEGTDRQPKYSSPKQLIAGGRTLDVYGMPSPNFADFDLDGDLDLICGEFLDGFTYFENTGSWYDPIYAAGRRLQYQGREIRMDLQMITPTAVDWNRDGYMDLIVGDEDGRVALVQHTGRVENGLPIFLPPRYFQQEAADVKFGALVTPFSFDWDGDGDEDLICGNTAGYVGFIENLNGADPPRWAAPKYLEADGQTIRTMAGGNGSIQGPCEAKWGYSTLSVADWDQDGLPDIIMNGIWGKVVWYRNIGTRRQPRLTAARSVDVEWPGLSPKPAWTWWQPQDRELVTQWRTTPYVIDWNEDGLNDLVMLDHEGYLAFYERYRDNGRLRLKPPARIFTGKEASVFDNKNRPQESRPGQPLQLNNAEGGSSGRRKLCFTDWDRDGRTDLLINSVNISFFRNVTSSTDTTIVLEDMGPLHEQELAGHTTSPTTVDWDRNGVPDLLIGAEDGRLYYLKNSR